MTDKLTRELCAALGLPKMTRRAVLTLEVGQLPALDLDVACSDTEGRPIVEELPGAYGNGVARRIASVQFMVRLVPFKS